MESSDDDSFAWTAASSRDSSEESANSIMTPSGVKNESFKAETSDSSHNTSKSRSSLEVKSKKKAKKMKVKEEPREEDCEEKPIKVKREYESQDSDDNELDVQVKLERASHRHDAHAHGADDSAGAATGEDTEPPTPHKKTKKHKHAKEHTNDVVNGDYSLEEHRLNKSEDSTKSKSDKKSKHTKRTIPDVKDTSEEHVENTLRELETVESTSNINVDKTPKKTKKRIHSTSYNQDISSDIEECGNNIQNEIGGSGQKERSKQSKSKSQHNQKISDRIRFEETDDSNLDTGQSNISDNNLPYHLRKFIQNNSQFTYASLQGDCLITQDDDLFLLKCPREVDVKLLKNKDLVFDHKCKFKVDGHSYDGSLEEQSNRIVVLSVGQNKANVMNLPLSGTANFRKRIPKLHYMHDSVIANNQTNFIPLPETKCRHPLFGSNYKKAIRVSSAIKARLNSVLETASLKEEKKKKKKSKHQDSQTEEEHAILTRQEPDSPVRDHSKKRKHKYTDSEEIVPKKKKKIKHDPDSSAVWESELAIEKSLFDF